MSKKPDYYAILGVLRDASQEEIKRAYLEAAQRLHPDKNQAPGETELFLDIQQAYEELSNPKRRAAYDASLPPVKTAPAGPIIYDVQYSRPNLVRMNEPQLVYVLLSVRANDQGEKIPAPPLNLCLVLDRSTSMKDAKMDLLKAATIQVMRSLRDGDTFSVVAFSDKAEIVIPGGYQPERNKLESRIRAIQPSGATEMFQGLQIGVAEVRRCYTPGRINQVILLTDGHTYGDEAACIDLAGKAAKAGIGITAMGIGTDWNDEFLDAVASRTGNSSHYIARPQDIQTILTEKFNDLTRVVADEVRIEPRSLEGARLNYAFRLQPGPGPVIMDDTINLGPVLRDTPLNVLFEFMVEPSAVQMDSLLFLDAQMKISVTALPTPVPPMRLRFERSVHAEAGSAAPPPEVIQALSRLTLYRMQDRARTEVKSGDYDGATRSLQNLAARLLSQGEQGLARTVLLEIENLQQKQTFSQEGEKAIKYATRSLFSSEGF